MSSGSTTNGVWCSVGVTKNMGNYNSLRVEAGTSREVTAEDNIEEIWAAIWEDVKAQVDAQLGLAD